VGFSATASLFWCLCKRKLKKVKACLHTVSALIINAQHILFKISNYPKENKTICISQEKICPSEGAGVRQRAKTTDWSRISIIFSLQDKNLITLAFRLSPL
jgi:hypothetical protein